MKKLLLLLSFIFIGLTVAYGQTGVYHPFPDSAVWRVDEIADCPFQYPYLVKYYYHYSVSGDTLINSYQYKKIERSFVLVNVIFWWLQSDPPVSRAACYAGALREDSLADKVYFVFPNTTNDSLLYDYNLTVGDTVKGCLSPFPGFHTGVIASVDSVLIDGQYRKRWNLNQCHVDPSNYIYPYIIEGIGSSSGLIEQLCTYSIDWYSRYLVCVRDSSGTLFTSSYNSVHNCDLIEGLNEIYSDNNVHLYPNPFSEQIKIQSDAPFKDATVTLCNSFGQKVMQKENISGQEFTLQRGDLLSGLYILQMKQANTLLFTAKLIIVDN
jgi:hypothetical protein